MGEIIIKIPQNIHEEFELEDPKEIEQLIRSLKKNKKEVKEKKKENLFLGLFADDPDLVDHITELAMQAREKHPLRIEDE